MLLSAIVWIKDRSDMLVIRASLVGFGLVWLGERSFLRHANDTHVDNSIEHGKD